MPLRPARRRDGTGGIGVRCAGRFGSPARPRHSAGGQPGSTSAAAAGGRSDRGPVLPPHRSDHRERGLGPHPRCGGRDPADRQCSLALIAGLEFANGALAAFTTPALRGVVPQLVDRDQLQKANALLGSTRNATRIVGPTTAGVVVAAAGSGQAIAIEAITYAIAAGCLLRLDASKTTTAARTPVGRNIREGASYFRSVRWLWPVSLAFFVVNLVQTGPWQILAPHIVSQHGGPQVWGPVLSSRAVGLLVMSVVMYRLVIRYPLRVTILGGAMAAVLLLSLGLGQPTGVVIVAVVLGGACASASAITWDSTLQEHIPHDKLSRVASIDDLLSYAAIPVGQLAAAGRINRGADRLPGVRPRLYRRDQRSTVEQIGP